MVTQKIDDISYGRYNIFIGQNGKRYEAWPYAKSRLIADCKVVGNDRENIVEEAKKLLDVKERALKAKRREPHIPTQAEFTEALTTESLKTNERKMLTAHATAKDATLTATEIAAAAGYKKYTSANLHYGTLAQKLADCVCVTPPSGVEGKVSVWTEVIADIRRHDDGDSTLVMHPELLAALQDLHYLKAETHDC